MRYPDVVLSEEFTREVRAALGVRDSDPIESPEYFALVKATHHALFDALVYGEKNPIEPKGILFLGKSPIAEILSYSLDVLKPDSPKPSKSDDEIATEALKNIKLFKSYDFPVIPKPFIDPIT